jgi:hypothetical protein
VFCQVFHIHAYDVPECASNKHHRQRCNTVWICMVLDLRLRLAVFPFAAGERLCEVAKTSSMTWSGAGQNYVNDIPRESRRPVTTTILADQWSTVSNTFDYTCPLAARTQQTHNLHTSQPCWPAQSLITRLSCVNARRGAQSPTGRSSVSQKSLAS